MNNSTHHFPLGTLLTTPNGNLFPIDRFADCPVYRVLCYWAPDGRRWGVAHADAVAGVEWMPRVPS